MMEGQRFNLEERTLAFAKTVRDFLKNIPYSLSNTEYAKQLIRSSGSIGANYIEASQSIGRKEFRMKIGISRKEAKESNYWLQLIESNLDIQKQLEKESLELTKIFSAIQRKIKI